MHLQAIVIVSLLASLWQPTVASKSSGDIVEWEEAKAIVSEGRSRWAEIFRSLDVDPAVCEAIVFPELLRYSKLRDGVEQAALLSLYAKGGTEAANFSVGIFQMKPSFAEQVEKAWMRTQLKEEYQLYFDTSNNLNARTKRVHRLKEEKWQCVYLAVFVKLMLEREQDLKDFPQEARIKYLSTAYNYSFTASMQELKERIPQKTFHLDIVRTKNTHCYSYSELSLKYYYQSQLINL